MAKSNNIQLLGGGVNPVGTIISFMGNNALEGYLICDGTEYNIVDYQSLADHFETEFGTKNNFGGDGTTTFAVPDLRGEFLRGTGTNSHTDQGSGGNVGSHQDDTEHLYIGSDVTNGNIWLQSNHIIASGSQYAAKVDNILGNTSEVPGRYFNKTGNITTGSSGEYAYTSRPTNTSVLYCIKY